MPDPATTAWVAAVIVNGGTVSSGRQTAVDNFIVGAKADGFWTKLDRLWFFAPRGEAFNASNTPAALTDLVGDTLATVNNSPTFSVDGYTGADVLNSAPDIDTGYTPGSGLYAQNDAHYSVWCMTNVAPAVGGEIVGSNLAGTGMYLTFPGDGNVYGRINETGFSGSLGAPGTRIGHWVVNRTGASAEATYQNGASFGTPNQTSGPIPTANFTILAAVATQGNPNTVSVASMGGSLSGTDLSNFYTRLSTYLAVTPSTIAQRRTLTDLGTRAGSRQIQAA